MNATILNRDFQHPSDGWYHIEPKGLHLNRESNVVQVIDDEAVQTIVNRFNADAAAESFPGMLIDHEHFQHDADKESRAYGWLMRLQNREDGVYGQVRWTTAGKAAVDGGEYRFFSTEYMPRDTAILNSASAPKRVRPLRLAGLTLTNSPNNKGARPITNREGNTLKGGHQTEFRQGVCAPGAEKENAVITNKRMKIVCARLGLSADASEEAALVEVGKLQSLAEKAEADLQPVKNRIAELEKTNKELLTAQVESDLERYKNRFKPDAKDKWKGQLLANRAGTIELLEGLPEIGKGPSTMKPIHNRGTAPDPKAIEGTAEGEASDADKARAAVIMNRAKELDAANPKRGWAACWSQAESEQGR